MIGCLLVLVAEAGNGREAIEQFRTHRPDITHFECGVQARPPAVKRHRLVPGAAGHGA